MSADPTAGPRPVARRWFAPSRRAGASEIALGIGALVVIGYFFLPTSLQDIVYQVPGMFAVVAVIAVCLLYCVTVAIGEWIGTTLSNLQQRHIDRKELT